MRKARRADRGWFEPGAEPVRDAYYGLAAAVLKQAARDALGRNNAGELRRLDAALWLLSDAPIWFDALGLGEIEPARFLARVSRGKGLTRAARLLEAEP